MIIVQYLWYKNLTLTQEDDMSRCQNIFNCVIRVFMFLTVHIVLRIIYWACSICEEFEELHYLIKTAIYAVIHSLLVFLIKLYRNKYVASNSVTVKGV